MFTASELIAWSVCMFLLALLGLRLLLIGVFWAAVKSCDTQLQVKMSMDLVLSWTWVNVYLFRLEHSSWVLPSPLRMSAACIPLIMSTKSAITQFAFIYYKEFLSEGIQYKETCCGMQMQSIDIWGGWHNFFLSTFGKET